MNKIRDPEAEEIDGIKIEKIGKNARAYKKRRLGRKVKEVNSGLEFNSVTEAAEHFRLSSRNSIYQAIVLYEGVIKNKKLKFAFVVI